MYLVTTENTKHEIETPAEALWENIDKRTRTGKSFRLKSGLNRQIITIGPQHYYDGGWQDIDTNVQAWNSREHEVTKAAYLWRNHRNGIGCEYKSRKGGVARMRLTSIGGRKLKWAEKPTPDACNLKQFSVATATDFHWQCKPERVAGWFTLHDETAPREWEWEFIHGKGVGIARSMRGFDGLNRPVEIECESSTERFRNGLYRTTLRKRWTGRVAELEPKTRAKTLTRDVVYPVAIDPDITERIVASNDDGTEFSSSSWSSGGTNVYIGSGSSYQPGFRFQSVAVPGGDAIDLCEIRLDFNGGSGGNVVGNWYMGDEDDFAAFSSSRRPSTVAATTASTGINKSTSDRGWFNFDITSSMQEVVDRGGFSSGNDVGVFALTSSGGYMRITSYDAFGSNEAFLYVDYTAAGGGSNPKGVFGLPLSGPLRRVLM